MKLPISALATLLTLTVGSDAASPCEDISGTWVSKTPTVLELYKPPTGPEISDRESLGEYTHEWVLVQDGCRIHGTNTWADTELDANGVPLKIGDEHLHGFMTPGGLAVLSETEYSEVVSTAPIRIEFYATLLENGDLHFVADDTNIEGDDLLIEGLLEKKQRKRDSKLT